jgi:Ca2+-transporting ATPase
VTDGFGFMLVTSAGKNTVWGEMMSSRKANEKIPILPAGKIKLILYIVTTGYFVATQILAVLLIQYFSGNTEDGWGNRKFNGSKTNFSDVMYAVACCSPHHASGYSKRPASGCDSNSGLFYEAYDG